jgi:diadenosine tetraphosphate (Ap4A) HIT family hydrolase
MCSNDRQAQIQLWRGLFRLAYAPPVTAYSDRVRAAADEQGRLRVPEQAMWEIFPFEPDSLVVKPLDPDVMPEPPRGGEGERPCWRCTDPDADVIWSDDRWLLAMMGELRLPFAAMLMPREHLDLGDLDDELAADLGRLTVLLDRAVRRLPDVERCHVNKWGDGGAHLHVAFLGRPSGMLQLRGSCLTLWEDMLPPVPPGVAAATMRHVAQELAQVRGQAHL